MGDPTRSDALESPEPVELVSADGATVRAWRWSAPRPHAARIVAVHGLGDHGRALPSMRLAHGLARHGLATWTFDLRGHGDVAVRDRGLAEWARLIDDLRAVVCAAGRDSPGPVAICGISLGALLAFELALDARADVAGVALAAAPFGPVRASRIAQGAARWLGRRLPRLPLATGIDLDAVADDPDAVRAWRGDDRVRTRVGAGLAAAALAAPARLRALAPRVRVPVLLQHGLDDRLAPWDPTFATALPTAWCTVRTYPDARHNLYLDRGAARVIGDLAAWAERVVERGARPVAAEPR